jgi:hypothetical protein
MLFVVQMESLEEVMRKKDTHSTYKLVETMRRIIDVEYLDRELLP